MKVTGQWASRRESWGPHWDPPRKEKKMLSLGLLAEWLKMLGSEPQNPSSNLMSGISGSKIMPGLHSRRGYLSRLSRNCEHDEVHTNVCIHTLMRELQDRYNSRKPQDSRVVLSIFFRLIDHRLNRSLKKPFFFYFWTFQSCLIDQAMIDRKNTKISVVGWEN